MAHLQAAARLGRDGRGGQGDLPHDLDTFLPCHTSIMVL